LGKTISENIIGKHASKEVKAGDIVSEIAPIVNGGGGGKPNMAQAGGKNPENIEQALQKAAQIIKQKLT